MIEARRKVSPSVFNLRESNGTGMRFAALIEAPREQEIDMAERKPKKPPKDNSLNEAPSQPDGVRRPSEGGVGKEYSRDPAGDAGSPTMPEPPF
jgi:hypothetical protein